MKYLLDTNIIIAFLKNDSNVVDFIENIELINVSAITTGEMFFGAYRSQKSNINFEIYSNFFSFCNILKISNDISKFHEKIKNELKNIGKPIPENDLWIAANSLEYSLT